MTLELTDEEAAALARYLRQKLDHERFPLAPRLDPLKAILRKAGAAGTTASVAAAVETGNGAERRPREAEAVISGDGLLSWKRCD